jgi:hypothetical protein
MIVVVGFNEKKVLFCTKGSSEWMEGGRRGVRRVAEKHAEQQVSIIGWRDVVGGGVE